MAIGDIQRTITTTIANGQTTTAAIDQGRANALLGIQTPAALTGTAFTFQASADGVTYAPLYDDAGAAVSVAVGTSRYIYLDPSIFAGIPYLKIVSGSAEGAERTLMLVVRPV